MQITGNPEKAPKPPQTFVIMTPVVWKPYPNKLRKAPRSKPELVPKVDNANPV